MPLPDEAEILDVTLQPGDNRFELFLDLSSAQKLWDEEDPYVYRLHISCCSDAVVQAEFDSYVITSGKILEFSVSLSYFRKLPMSYDKLVCYLKDSVGNVISYIDASVTALTENSIHAIGILKAFHPFPRLPISRFCCILSICPH